MTKAAQKNGCCQERGGGRVIHIPQTDGDVSRPGVKDGMREPEDALAADEFSQTRAACQQRHKVGGHFQPHDFADLQDAVFG